MKSAASVLLSTLATFSNFIPGASNLKAAHIKTEEAAEFNDKEIV